VNRPALIAAASSTRAPQRRHRCGPCPSVPRSASPRLCGRRGGHHDRVSRTGNQAMTKATRPARCAAVTNSHADVNAECDGVALAAVGRCLLSWSASTLTGPRLRRSNVDAYCRAHASMGPVLHPSGEYRAHLDSRGGTVHGGASAAGRSESAGCRWPQLGVTLRVP
jgi:hypothetical protein